MLKAIIFDFDGVITDSEPVHLMMFQKVLAEMGLSLTETEYYDTYLGMDDKGCFSTLLQSQGIAVTDDLIQSLIKKKTTYLMEYINNDLFIYPGVRDFIDLSQKRFRLSIASGALRHEIEFILDRAGLGSVFDIIVSADDVREGKPDPECFNRALEEMNVHWGERVRHDECLVIEDSVAGIEAARAAGMWCIAVTNTYGPEKLAMADRVVKSLEEISLEDLENLGRINKSIKP